MLPAPAHIIVVVDVVTYAPPSSSLDIEAALRLFPAVVLLPFVVLRRRRDDDRRSTAMAGWSEFDLLASGGK